MSWKPEVIADEDEPDRDVAAYVEMARHLRQDAGTDIDFGETVVSITDTGMWVRAWVYVSDEDMNELHGKAR